MSGQDTEKAELMVQHLAGRIARLEVELAAVTAEAQILVNLLGEQETPDAE